MTQDMMNIRYGYSKLVARGLFSCAATCRFFILVLLMIAGIENVWAQTGVYYFINRGSGKSGDPLIKDISDLNNYFYLVPADNPQQANKRDAWFSSDYSAADGDSEKPYLTTYRTIKDAASVPTGVTNRPHNSVWILQESNESGYYYIIHAATGKYVVYGPPYSTKINRKSVHLESTTNPGNEAEFAITFNSEYYNFRPRNIGTGDNDNKYFNPAQQNYTAYYSNDSKTDGDADYFRGLVGLWKNNGVIEDGTGSDWKLETVTLTELPTISEVSEETNKVTVTGPSWLPAGYNIRYTFSAEGEPADPTATSTEMTNGEFTVTNAGTLKVVVERYGVLLSAVESKFVEPAQCKTPVITYSTEEGKVSIASETPNAAIYYTIDGETPTTPYNGPFGVADQQTVKAIATNTESGFRESEAASSKLVLNPTIILAATDYTYSGSAIVPNISSVMDGETPIDVKEYTVYSDNTNAGTATVNIVDNNGGDYIVYGSTTFTISKKDLAVTAKPKTITYGDAPTNAGVTYSGFVGEETAESVLSGELDYEYTYSQYDDVSSSTNTYTITPKGLTSSNYEITFAPGTLTVDQKEVGLDWSETTSFIYDGTSHCLTATATGMVNSDEIGVTVTGEQTNAGNYTATASELTGAKVGNYKLPAENTHAFTINPVELTVTANDHSITYGNAPSGNGVTYDGFVNGETESVLEGTLAYTYSYSQYGDVGTYTITPKGLTGVNYSISYVNGTLTVNPKALAVTAEAKTKVYGDADPELTYTSVGLINTDAITGDLSRVYGEDVGTYDISQGTLAAPNYTITYTGANLTITQKTLTVTANPKTITYGDAPTNDGVIYSGFAYYENENFLLGTLAYAYSYKQYGNVGEYTITPSGLINDNYSFTYVPGTLTVDQKEVGLDWSETTSFPYDGTSHCLTATATGIVNNDEVVVTVSGDQIAAGNHIATASGLTGTNAGNYKLPADNTQGFTITKAALSVTATDNAITYGQAPSGNGVTYDGFVNGETESVSGVLEGTVDYDYNYKQFGDVGTYTITPKGLTSNNYDISFVAGTLTVEQKEVGLTWDDATPSFTYDGEEHAPTATVTGMVNNDAITVTVLGAQTNAGVDYPATASLTGDKAGNYKLPTANTQLFTITQKSIGNGTLTSDYILDFGESNTILLTDDVIGSALVINTDYTVGNDTDPSTKYSLRTVTGIGNYTGSFSVRNAVVSFTTDSDQQEWSATFVAESSGATIGHALPEGVCAFIISGIEGEWAIPEPLDYIPAGVPVLLVSHKQINGFVVTDVESGDVTQDQKDRNMLEEVTEATTGYDSGTESAPFATKQIYVLYNNEFVFNKAGNMKKGKVYLNPNHTVPSSTPAPARLKIAWNDMTGIEDGRWKMEDGRSERWYTIDGRRLNGKPTTKGLYINNGNKVVIK